MGYMKNILSKPFVQSDIPLRTLSNLPPAINPVVRAKIILIQS